MVNLDCIGVLGEGPLLVDPGDMDEGKRLADLILRRLTDAGISDLGLQPLTSDHTVFQDRGFPAISILASRDCFLRYHTAADTVDALDIGELAAMVEALARALTEP